MEAATAWFACATTSLDAARRLAASHPRSSVSRSYYAAFSAAHAMLMNLGDRPRETEGTWTHTALPDAVRATAARGNLGGRQIEAASLRRGLLQLRELRESADYMPLRTIDVAAAMGGCRLAGQIVAIAKRRFA